MEQKTILVIEDEPTINRIISMYFIKENFKVFSALDGEKGLKMFNENHIDLICLDIMMPNVNGWEIAETIRDISNVPIIMMSALSEEEDILKGYSLGVDDYISKPFAPAVLVAKINSLFDRIEYAESSQHLNEEFNIKGLNLDGNSIDGSSTLRDLLTLDELTGIPNRRYLDFHISNLIKNSRDFDMNFGLLFFDIDHFKNVNDTYGHNVGDIVLKELAQIFKVNLRNKDLIGRWGGEEFLGVIQVEDKIHLKLISEKLRKIVEEYKFNNELEKGISISVSIGGTMYKKGENLDELVERADKNMYYSKEHGRNRVTIK